MSIYLNQASEAEIEAHARESYPDECCGFMFGHINHADERLVNQTQRVENILQVDRRRRFEISPREYMAAEDYAEEHALTLLGIYHSHPDHPPVASATDLKYAQPFFSYVIQSVREGYIADLRSWRLSSESRFEEEVILQAPPSIP